MAVYLHLPLRPVPASRPRVTRWGTYYSKTYTAWRKAAAELIPKATSPLEGPLRVRVLSLVERPRTSRLPHPKPDVDNYAKAALDVVTSHGGQWHDDAQIIHLTTEKRWCEPEEEEGTYILIEPA